METDFGKAMRSIREERKMTLEEMAAYLGTTKQALSRYERGERTPKITIAAKFAEMLDVPLELLIGYEYHEEIQDDFYERESKPQTSEARIIAKGIDKLPKEQREQALAVIKAMFNKYTEFFEKESTTDDAGL